MKRWIGRGRVYGVFWRQLLRLAVLNCPPFVEPTVMAWWSAFFLLWGPGRRGVMRNLSIIKPGSWAITNFFRTYRVFWNFAWTITDNARFRELAITPDWHFKGLEHLAELESRPGGAIILTAHMGSYDLGANVFSTVSSRQIVMVRAPETDPKTQQFESEQRETGTAETLRVNFNVNSTDLAIELLHAIEAGHLIAIQGDRVTSGVASVNVKFFGRTVPLPAGPFALAMASRAPIYPLFIIRGGRRRYVLQTCPPITVERRSRNRDEDLRAAVQAWAQQLETVVASQWQQWFTFEPFAPELA
ncbi:MAG TPA: lysophospholipid acyltransferase family protein [Thermoanaerobaculia bacterium]